jgi:hypothetical protein
MALAADPTRNGDKEVCLFKSPSKTHPREQINKYKPAAADRSQRQSFLPKSARIPTYALGKKD